MSVQADQFPPVLSTQTAVLTTLYENDSLEQFDIAVGSIEAQAGFGAYTRIYLCCDGPLPTRHESWLEQNASRFYKIVRNAQNEGLAKSLNALLEVLEDESFVFRMDGDDISHPERFRSQIAYLEANPELGLIGCQVTDIDDSGKPSGQRNFPLSHDACTRALRCLNPVLHPTYCMRGDVARDPATRYPVAFLSEDLAFLVTLVERGVKIGNCPDRVFSWRLGSRFFERRSSLKRGLAELYWYSRAIRARNGLLTADYCLAVARFLLRVAPAGFMRMIYQSPLRTKVMNGRA
ncbi:glycosyltransferase [Leisingera sp. ANG-DT]|uniref:glycosyltransferase n=1 Tax=Leisingera sp. ANG-DT TaxID=1577897 RepID=UPI00057D66E8|nr:glycosyltransferase [Leisingera sp. ANG-DT]KIC18720.1 hypothetical protein RA21_04355 [Leisingera sp. ANG-DT]